MKKLMMLVIVLGLGILLACSSEHEARNQGNDSSPGVQFQQLTLDQALNQATQSGKLLLIDLYSDG